MYQRIDIDDYVRTGEGATAVGASRERISAQLWVFTNRPDEDRQKRLLPFAAVRIPFMLNMAYRRPISEGLAGFVIDQIG